MATNSTPTTPLAAWYDARRQTAAVAVVRRSAPELPPAELEVAAREPRFQLQGELDLAARQIQSLTDRLAPAVGELKEATDGLRAIGQDLAGARRDGVPAEVQTAEVGARWARLGQEKGLLARLGRDAERALTQARDLRAEWAREVGGEVPPAFEAAFGRLGLVLEAATAALEQASVAETGARASADAAAKEASGRRAARAAAAAREASRAAPTMSGPKPDRQRKLADKKAADVAYRAAARGPGRGGK